MCSEIKISDIKGFVKMKDNVIKIIACPKCKGNLKLNEKKQRLNCKRCKLDFQMQDGNFPILMSEK